MLGKTNMDEFGMGAVSSSFKGAVKNPWNLASNSPWKKSIDYLDKDNDWYIAYVEFSRIFFQTIRFVSFSFVGVDRRVEVRPLLLLVLQILVLVRTLVGLSAIRLPFAVVLVLNQPMGLYHDLALYH
jgi:hypothetical protein